jgi:hypothetical protein
LCYLDFALAAFASLSLSAATAKRGMGILGSRPRALVSKSVEQLTPFSGRLLFALPQW